MDPKWPATIELESATAKGASGRQVRQLAFRGPTAAGIKCVVYREQCLCLH
jgi:hypothetical protein